MKNRNKIIFSAMILLIISIIIVVLVKNEKGQNNPLPEAFQDETFPSEDEIEESDEEGEQEVENEPASGRLSDKVRSAVSRFFNQEVNIVAIGDSLTQGVGDSTNNGGYVGILKRTMDNEEHDLSIQFSNYGKRGNRTDQMLERLEDEEIQADIKQADIILVTIGANDIMQVVKENITDITLDLFTEERNHFEERLREIISTISDLNGNAEIYLLGIYNPFEKYFKEIEELNEIVNQWNQTGITITGEFDQTTFIPIQDIFKDATTELFSDDNFHPNTTGYHRMAERVFEYLTKER